MQLTCSPVYSISLFTFNFTKPLPEPAYTWTTPDYRGLENRPRDIGTRLRILKENKTNRERERERIIYALLYMNRHCANFELK